MTAATTNATATPFRVVLYEGQGARPMESAQRLELSRGLLEKGYAVSVVRSGSFVSDMAQGILVVLGWFDAVKPSQSEAVDRPVKVLFRDLAGLDFAGVMAMLETLREGVQAPAPGKWKPWFPVIDYSRCTNCMQCLSFCLFDVYGVSKEGKIQVQHETHCKTDCPACSRVCPEVAILFPKYRFGPINGDEVNAEDVRREAMKVDISALLGGDIYQALRDRSERAKSRFSKERDDERALAERQRCLKQLQEAMDIPPEVIASLPSLEQIQAKAVAAKARAEAALKKNN